MCMCMCMCVVLCSKPLFRWTIGSCLQQGLDVLAESIARTTKTLGIDGWDWVVCYNALRKEDVEFLEGAIGDRPIKLYAQNWANCAIGDNCQSPRRRDGSFEWNGNRCGGTLWKVTPARMRMETHEIVMDNDVILLKKFQQIDEWLAQTDKSLILEEPIKFYGRYECLFPGEGPFLNSGFMGFPPNYDYASDLNENWVKHGKFMNLSQADEQGLLTYTLNQLDNIRISNEQMVEFLGRDYAAKVTGKESALHFTQSNRMPNHRAWLQYKELSKGNVSL